MNKSLLTLMKAISFMVLLVISKNGYAQKIKSDSELLQVVDKHLQTPIKTIVLENGDVFLQRDQTAVAETITSSKKYNSKNELISTEHGTEGCHHDGDAIARFLNSPQPSVKTMEKYFELASSKYNVPIEILKAMGQIQSNWAQAPVSIYGSYGVMGLIESENVKQIDLASKLSGLSPNDIKTNAKSNIMAAAALLAYHQKSQAKSSKLEDWYEATRQLTGFTNDELKTSLANRVFKLINDGSKTVTNWKEIINIEAKSVKISISTLKTKPNKTEKTSAYTVDYTSAISRFSLCDTSNSNGLPATNTSGTAYLGTYSLSRNGAAIEYYFIHYVAVGTYEGAISYFGDCYRTTQSSANYVIRNSDGQVSQVVKEAHRAFAQGNTQYNNGGISTEHEVIATNLAMWDSEPMLVASANLAIDVCNRNLIPRQERTFVGAKGIYQHKDVRATDCPNMTPTQWSGLIARISGGVVIPTVMMPTLYTIMNTGVANQITASWKASTDTNLLGYRLYYATDDTQLSWALVADESTLTAAVTTTTLNPADFIIVPTGEVYHFRLTAVVSNGANPNVESIASDVYSRSSNTTGDKVLIVDGFDRINAYSKAYHNFSTSYFNELNNNAALQISSVANEKVEDGTVLMTNYDIVIWYTGDDSSAAVTLSANEKAKVKAFLENGGKLLLSGSEIAYNLGRSAATAYDLPFMNDYLKSNYVSDGITADTPAVGIIGSAFEGVSCALGTIYAEKYPDNITAVGGATNVFSYTSAGKFGGITYSGTFGTSSNTAKLVYVSFGVENISKTERDAFMKKALTYFNVPSLGEKEIALNDKKQIILYPNPFDSELKININTNEIGTASIRIFDLNGRIIKESAVSTSGSFSNESTINTENLTKGMYLCEVKLPDGQVQVSKIIKK